jgi:hypothetical protein
MEDEEEVIIDGVAAEGAESGTTDAAEGETTSTDSTEAVPPTE